MSVWVARMVEIEMCGFNFFWIIIMIQASAVLGSFEILIKVGSCTLLLECPCNNPILMESKFLQQKETNLSILGVYFCMMK